MTVKKFLLICASPIILLALISPFVPKREEPAPPPAAESRPPEPPGLELLEAEGTVTDSGGYIEGRIRNNQETTIRRAIVWFVLYNDAGEQVGKTWADTDGIEPGGTREFKASSSLRGWTKFQVEELTGF